MTWSDLLPERSGRRFNRRIMLYLALGYPLLFVLGYLSKSVAGSSAIWPSHALTFAAYMLLPVRRWAFVALAASAWDLLLQTIMYWVTIRAQASLQLACCFALANVLTSMGPARCWDLRRVRLPREFRWLRVT